MSVLSDTPIRVSGEISELIVNSVVRLVEEERSSYNDELGISC
jgi:hypothetical protein